jgi:hypothetical protein
VRQNQIVTMSEANDLPFFRRSKTKAFAQDENAENVDFVTPSPRANQN